MHSRTVVYGDASVFTVSAKNQDSDTVFTFNDGFHPPKQLRCFRTHNKTADPNVWLDSVPEAILGHVAAVVFESARSEEVTEQLLGAAISILIGYAPNASDIEIRLCARQLAVEAITGVAMISRTISLPSAVPSSLADIAAIFSRKQSQEFAGRTLPLTADRVQWHHGMELWEEGWYDGDHVSGLRCIEPNSTLIQWERGVFDLPGSWFVTGADERDYSLGDLYSTRDAAIDAMKKAAQSEYDTAMAAINALKVK